MIKNNKDSKIYSCTRNRSKYIVEEERESVINLLNHYQITNFTKGTNTKVNIAIIDTIYLLLVYALA